MSDYSLPDPAHDLPTTKPTDPNSTEPGSLEEPDHADPDLLHGDDES